MKTRRMAIISALALLLLVLLSACQGPPNQETEFLSDWSRWHFAVGRETGGWHYPAGKDRLEEFANLAPGSRFIRQPNPRLAELEAMTPQDWVRIGNERGVAAAEELRRELVRLREETPMILEWGRRVSADTARKFSSYVRAQWAYSDAYNESSRLAKLETARFQRYFDSLPRLGTDRIKQQASCSDTIIRSDPFFPRLLGDPEDDPLFGGPGDGKPRGYPSVNFRKACEVTESVRWFIRSYMEEYSYFFYEKGYSYTAWKARQEMGKGENK